MRTRFILCASLLSGLLLTSTNLFAQQSGGVQIRGNQQINVNAENVNTIAVGQGNTAKTSIGTVKAGSGSQPTNVTVDVKNVSNVTSGRGRKSCINIGTVNADPECK